MAPEGARAAVILEEKPICRGAIAAVVAGVEGFGLPTFAGSLSEASAEVQRAKPDLVLVDLFSIGYDFESLEQFITSNTPIRVIVIDDRVNPSFARLARDAGAMGYACKNFEIDAFQATVSSVAAGHMEFPAAPRLQRRSEVAPEIRTGG